MAKTVMIQGTSSYAGKTLLVTALCRILAKEGYLVAPFKAQNMSLNSYITSDSREIARAQALQAMAAGVEPEADMNPILLKPTGNLSSQIVLMGRPYREISARRYYRDFALKEGIRVVKESLQKLMAKYSVVVIEGAGSPAELNLYGHEIVNMRVAELASSPVLLVADIDRGGVFASLFGTLALLKPKHRSLVKGLVINKFRGDISILRPGIRKLEKITGKPILGVVPYIEDLRLPGEDSASLEDMGTGKKVERKGGLNIAVLHLPRISNFTDFDAFTSIGVNVRYVRSPTEISDPDLVIIPGSKNVVADLKWVRKRGFDTQIAAFREKQIPIIGICGGFQILGKKIIDPHGFEGGAPGTYRGLGLLDAVTTFKDYAKVTRRVVAEAIGDGPLLAGSKGHSIRGYEIHMGESEIGSDKPLFRLSSQTGKSYYLDGAVSDDGLVFGTYIHGLFDDSAVRNSILSCLFARKRGSGHFNRRLIDDTRIRSLDRLAESVRANLDMLAIYDIMGLSGRL